jgi:hypothetical protein
VGVHDKYLVAPLTIDPRCGQQKVIGLIRVHPFTHLDGGVGILLQPHHGAQHHPSRQIRPRSFHRRRTRNGTGAGPIAVAEGSDCRLSLAVSNFIIFRIARINTPEQRLSRFTC